MNLHEYKQIHTQYGSKFAVVKAQIHAGGRGKGKIVGKEQKGVAVGKNAEDVKQIAQNILGGTLVTIQTGPQVKWSIKYWWHRMFIMMAPTRLRNFTFPFCWTEPKSKM